MKDKAKLGKVMREDMSERLTVRISKDETVQIIPKVNSYNQITYVEIAKFRFKRKVASVRIKRQCLSLFLQKIELFKSHIEEESLDMRIPELTRHRIR